MSKEEKMKRLLEMQEHPERYTDEQIRQQMADEEFRQLYEQMVRATDAMFEARHFNHGSIEKPKMFTLNPSLKKMAAMFIGVLMLSGIAYAAIYILTPQTHPQPLPVEGGKKKVYAPLPQQGGVGGGSVFENVPLGDIVRKMATHYGAKVEVRNAKAAALRLFYPWNPQMPLQQVVDELNRFEKVNLTFKDNKLIIE